LIIRGEPLEGTEARRKAKEAKGKWSAAELKTMKYELKDRTTKNGYLLKVLRCRIKNDEA
jgi:hypothetical protein